ncbi:hypothetical protein BJ878DRAFT_62932 [Calycina marina]|uniref:Uncharacterized protein n=1 Tax=Calycina marina TaxID=1763456 RepID=A0A9P7ZAT9_9HELO|nr:hypothetical protein BJ878DRAFT_62932 [Calycina marina]
MSSNSRYAALAAMISSVYGYSLGEMAAQTTGVGLPLYEIRPTEAPSLELVRRTLGVNAKRALTNTCDEWSLDGLGGTPLCGASATCLFTSATNGFLYEGCGQTSIAYDWITACWPYPQTQPITAPVSELYCPSTAPACGYYAFVYQIGQTFWNFGCSITSYSSFAYQVANATSAALVGNGGSSLTDISSAFASIATFPAAGTGEGSASTADVSGSAPTLVAWPTDSTSTNKPTIKANKTKKNVPIGPIVGGLIGGVILIVATVVITWCCIRRKKKATKDGNLPQQHQIDSGAFQTQQHINELGGNNKLPGPPLAAYMNTSPQTEKPGAEYGYTAPQTATTELGGGDRVSMQSPPPVYAHGNCTELYHDNNGRQSTPPVSPVGTYYNDNNNDGIRPGGASPYSPAGATSSSAELGSGSVLSGEFGATQQQQQQQQQTWPQEMSGSDGIVRRPVRTSQQVDLNGNPMTDNYPQELA